MGNALFIIWRESAEAMLVVGILYAWLRKHPDVKRGMRYLWAGVGAGLALALALAAVMLGIARTLSDQGLEYFQTAMMLIAAGLIVQMVFWMRRHGRTFKRELEHNMQKNASAANWWGLLLVVAFTRASNPRPSRKLTWSMTPTWSRPADRIWASMSCRALGAVGRSPGGGTKPTCGVSM